MENNNINNDTYLASWLAGDLSDNDLKSNVGDQEYLVYLKLKRALEVSEQLDAPIENSFHKLQARLQPKKKTVIPLMAKRLLAIAASFLLVLSVFNFLKSNEHKISTSIGEHKSFVLEDGSEVILNSKSTITYNSQNWVENHQKTHKISQFLPNN